MPAMQPSWTKADLARVKFAFDTWTLTTAPDKDVSGIEAAKAKWNAGTAEHAAAIACKVLREYPGKDPAEVRARAKLADRIERDGLPPGTEIPRLTLMSEHYAAVRAEQRAERERAEALALAEAERRKPKPRDLAATREHLRFNVEAELAEGCVRVAHRDGQPFGDPDIAWSEFDPVAWATWLRPSARADVDDAKWAMATDGSEASERFVPSLTALWSVACADRELPDVLDLSRAPSFHGMLRDPWVKALASAIRKRSRGIVILVDANADIHARVLPSYVGPT